MKNNFEKQKEKQIKERQRRLNWYKVVSVLVAVVVFVTTYALIIPAITWDKTLICELSEHTHNAECYDGDELICTVAEHTHTEKCFDAPPSVESGYRCGLIEHTHSDECYYPDGSLRCTLPEHKHTYTCSNDFGPAKAAPMLLAATPQTGTYYQRVDRIDSTSANYLIVSVQGNYALVAGNSGATTAAGTQLKLIPVKGNPGYYTISSVTSAMQWQFGSTVTGSGGTTIRRGTDGVYLYQTRAGSRNNYTYPLFNTSGGSEQLTYNSVDGTWTIRGTATNATAYYLYLNNSSFSSSNSTSNTFYRNMLILKQVNTTLDIPDDVVPEESGSSEGESGKQQPTYREDTDAISGGKQGSVSDVSDVISGISDDITLQYASDAATSDIEHDYISKTTNGISPEVNDGKVLTDKSVIYKDDDYNAFRSYAEGTFGVALSALGQDYQFKEEFQVRIPVDVVFVLDVSGSMGNAAGNITRVEAVVNAVNIAMDQIMNDNSENRAGVVMFSSGGSKLLDLDHYTAGRNGQYLRYDTSGDIYTATNVSGANVGTVASTNGEVDGFTQAQGTYTQYGIALGSKLLEENDDITYTATMYPGTDYEKHVTVKRKPVIILLSDGEPTHCTSNYTDVLNGPAYGSGAYRSTSNNKGVLGFYTILSANYYKSLVGIHYDTPAGFYTIGMGINETGYTDLSGRSSTGDCYKRAVLNPTSAAISDMLSNGARNTNPNSSYTAAETWSITCQMLSQLLGNTYTQSTVTLLSSTSYRNAIGTAHSVIPVLNNPYINYSYADDAYFGNLDQEDLESIFGDIISQSLNVKNYGFMLSRGTSVEVSDEIGEGMEIKGIPVLRYNGVNYQLTQKSSRDGVVTYVCNSIATTTDGSGVNGSQRSADLSEILIQVRNENGKQTVFMTVPEAILPSYTPDAGEDWYYEELPVRLIYQVGLTAESQQRVAALRPGQSLKFYTNAWNGTTAKSAQEPHPDNPFYNNVTYDNGSSRMKQYRDYSAQKEENFTGTADTFVNSYEETTSDNRNLVLNELGNNGVLVFQNSAITTVSLTLQKVDMAGTPITDNTAGFELYSDEELNTKVGTYFTGVDGTLTVDGLTPNVNYYLVEVRAPDGYSRMTAVKSFRLSADGTVTHLPPDDGYLSYQDGMLLVRNPNGYALPATGGKGNRALPCVGLLLLACAFIFGVRYRRKIAEM